MKQKISLIIGFVSLGIAALNFLAYENFKSMSIHNGSYDDMGYAISLYIFGAIGIFFVAYPILEAFLYRFSIRISLWIPVAIGLVFFLIGMVADDFVSLLIYFPVGIVFILIAIGTVLLRALSSESPVLPEDTVQSEQSEKAIANVEGNDVSGIKKFLPSKSVLMVAIIIALVLALIILKRF